MRDELYYDYTLLTSINTMMIYIVAAHQHRVTKKNSPSSVHTFFRAMKNFFFFLSSLAFSHFFSFSSVTDSPSVVTTQSSTTVPFFSSCVNEQAQELLTTLVQLGNRQEIEQLKNQIQVRNETYFIHWFSFSSILLFFF